MSKLEHPRPQGLLHVAAFSQVVWSPTHHDPALVNAVEKRSEAVASQAARPAVLFVAAARS